MTMLLSAFLAGSLGCTSSEDNRDGAAAEAALEDNAKPLEPSVLGTNTKRPHVEARTSNTTAAPNDSQVEEAKSVPRKVETDVKVGTNSQHLASSADAGSTSGSPENIASATTGEDAQQLAPFPALSGLPTKASVGLSALGKTLKLAMGRRDSLAAARAVTQAATLARSQTDRQFAETMYLAHADWSVAWRQVLAGVRRSQRGDIVTSPRGPIAITGKEADTVTLRIQGGDPQSVSTKMATMPLWFADAMLRYQGRERGIATPRLQVALQLFDNESSPSEAEQSILEAQSAGYFVDHLLSLGQLEGSTSTDVP